MCWRSWTWTCAWLSLPFIGPKQRSAIPLGSEGTDFWGCHIRKAQNDFNTYYEFYDYPLAGAENADDVHSHCCQAWTGGTTQRFLTPLKWRTAKSRARSCSFAGCL